MSQLSEFIDRIRYADEEKVRRVLKVGGGVVLILAVLAGG